ncbi:MAG TPA: tRNA (adenosine(37)-N6)-threonylcarbamoyltransferase complex ATPase subunit type 1 TsaE [Candidatus Limnocylindrales bacterium]|nr:tRNA (adenosine(37)-N6)-threonylcarbamoyltransferase complex ATPase subunit type 1 TsaE [Candidatus Limnocylindrales bacterium]
MPAPTAAQQVVTSPDPAATRELGRRLGVVARAGDLVALYGELGAGKTQLVKGVAAGLGVVDTVSSPSFVLMGEYEGRVPLFHLDLYRLDGPADVIGGGLLDERQVIGLTIIEWAERLGASIPRDRLDVSIDGTGDAPRTIRLRTTSAAYARYLEAVR